MGFIWKASFAKGSKILTAEWQEIQDAIEWFATTNRCSTDNLNCVHYSGDHTGNYTSDDSSYDSSYDSSHNGQSHNGSGHNSSHNYPDYSRHHATFKGNDSVLCPGGTGIY